MKTIFRNAMIFAAAVFGPLSLSASTPDPAKWLSDSLPGGWSTDRQFTQTLPSDDSWWKEFNDTILTRLIETGERNSFDLSQTMRRMEISRLQWESAKSAYFPTIGATAGWSKQRASGATVPNGVASTTDFMSLGLDLNWEIDVFGRVAANRKAGKATYEASKADYEAAMVSLAANIAKAYTNLRMVQAEIEVTISQVRSQEEIVRMTTTRHEVGLVSKLDVSQAQVVLYSTQASLPSLEALEKSAIASIATLIGCYPAEITPMLEQTAPIPNPFRMVQAGVPADLLRRRPDLVAAEWQISALAAEVGVAKKDFLPVLSLTGSIGTSAHRGKDLFTKKSFTYSIAPQLSWTIFEGLARNYKVAEAKQQLLAGIDSYNQTVMTAVTEAQDAMDTYMATLRQIEMTRKVVEQCRDTYELSVDRYKNGLTAFSDVVTAQINLLQYTNSLVEARGNALSSLIDIYKALGGAPEGLK